MNFKLDSIYTDFLKNCESELMRNENLFGDETFLSDLGGPIALENDQFDFLNMSTDNDFKDSTIVDEFEDSNVIMMSTETPKQEPQPLQLKQRSPQQISVPPTITAEPIKLTTNQPPRISAPQSAAAVFTSQYTIPQNVNFTVQSPVVTLAPVPVAANQRLVASLMPAKLIKSESVYPRVSQTVTSTSVQHQIHTLVNTANGTVLATGNY